MATTIQSLTETIKMMTELRDSLIKKEGRVIYVAKLGAGKGDYEPLYDINKYTKKDYITKNDEEFAYHFVKDLLENTVMTKDKYDGYPLYQILDFAITVRDKLTDDGLKRLNEMCAEYARSRYAAEINFLNSDKHVTCPNMNTLMLDFNGSCYDYVSKFINKNIKMYNDSGIIEITKSASSIRMMLHSHIRSEYAELIGCNTFI